MSAALIEALFPWQLAAIDAWAKGDDHGPYRGTLEIFTGGGKTLMALAAYERLRREVDNLRLVVVVPTVALARQWAERCATDPDVSPSEIGLLGAGGDSSPSSHRIVVAVLNSAADFLPEHTVPAEQLMLVVDECHRAGADVFRRVLDTPAVYRLGLSATPQRDDTDEYGQPIAYDDSVLGRKLGRIVYRFGLREAREVGWLPEYELHHHAVRLEPDERSEYDRLSRRVDEAAQTLRDAGHPTIAARRLSGRADAVGDAAREYVAATASRKDLLYRARQRHRIADLLVRSDSPRTRAAASSSSTSVSRRPRRSTTCSRLHCRRVRRWGSSTPDEATRSVPRRSRGSPPVPRRSSFQVRSLIEGIDVPEADVGVSVASSSSVRQRVQSLGRVLRRSFDDQTTKKAAMHVVYVHDTVDDFIYAREDWSDLIGEEVNQYWLWELDGGPTRQGGPPHTPRPTEDQIWAELGGVVPDEPVAWSGLLPEFEYSVDTRGNMRTAGGAPVANVEDVAEMVTRVRGRPGGRFRVTPIHRLVLVTDGTGTPMIAGQLDAFPEVMDATVEAVPDEARQGSPGTVLPARPNADRGHYRIRQKAGGVIERRVGRDREFALTDEPATRDRAAVRILAAWRALGLPGLPISIDETGVVWFEEGGLSRLLVAIDDDALHFPTDHGGD